MKRIVFFIGIYIFFFSTYSQEVVQAFRPVFSVGVVGSQIDGDTYSGFHKLGYFFGVGINRQFSKLIEMEFAITFLQKGARSNYATDSASLNNPNNNFSLIRLNYVEVPLAIGFNIKRFKIDAGGYAAYLFINPPHDENQYGKIVDPNFKNTDFGWLIGFGCKLKPNFLINLRYQYSFVPIRDYYTSSRGIFHGQFPRNLFNTGLYNNYLVLSFNYKLPVKPTTIVAP